MSGNELLKSRADAAVLSRDFALAARLYNTLLQQSPDDISLLEKMGSIYVKSGDDAKALLYYKKINSLKPNDFSTLNNLGGIYRRLKQYDKSIEVLKDALKLNKDAAQVNYNLGFTYKFMERYDEAVECFETVIQLNPNDVLAYNHLGAIHYKRGELQTAIQTYKKGLKVDINHPVLHLNLAKSYEKENEIQNAIAEYEAALRTKPGWHDAIADYSKFLIKIKKTKSARDLVEQSLRLNPRDAKMYVILGNILYEQSDYENAGEQYKKALSFDPENKKALIGCAKTFSDSGNASHAVEYIEHAEKSYPDDEKILKTSADIFLSANKIAGVSSKIKKLIQKDSGDIETLDLAGQYYILKNNEQQAVACYKKINQIDPESVTHFKNAARRFKQLEKFEKASNYISRYVNKNPNDSKALVLYALINESLGKVDEAVALFEKAILVDGDNVFAKNNLVRLSEFAEKLDQSEESAELENLSDEELSLDVPEVQEEIPQENPEDENSVPMENDKNLIDEEASSTDSELWKSESWDADKIVEDNEDPFAVLDGDDQSVLTGASVGEAEEDEEEINLDEEQEDAAPSIAPSLDSLVDQMPKYDDNSEPEKKKTSDDDDEFAQDIFNDDDFEKPDDGGIEKSLAEKNNGDDFDSEFDSDDDFGNINSSDDAIPPREMQNQNPSPYSNPYQSPLPPMNQPLSPLDNFPDDMSNQVPQTQMPRNSVPQQNPTGLTAEDSMRLMNSMMETQRGAERAVNAAQKAWDAATKAADAAQIARESENALNDMANDAILKAAEKVKEQTEQFAKEAAEKALAEKMSQMDDLLPAFEKLLNQNVPVPQEKNESLNKTLALLKSLRKIGESLPEEPKHQFLQSKNRIKLDYLIGRLSGKKGLLQVAQKLRDDGLVKNFVSESEVPLNYSGKRLCGDVLSNIINMSTNISDQDLAFGMKDMIQKISDKL